MKRLVCFLAVLIITFSCLCSCSKEQRSASEILSALMADSGELPSGQIYLKNAKEGEDGYFNESLAVSMYGEDGREISALCEDMAIYLSESAPYEIAVFKCYSSSDAQKIGALCMRRLDILRVHLRHTEWYGSAESAKISVKGRVAVMSLTPIR